MTDTPLRPETFAALAEAIRDALAHEEPVVLPGLGRLAVAHEPSRVVVRDGQRVLLPPLDYVSFEPAAP